MGFWGIGKSYWKGTVSFKQEWTAGPISKRIPKCQVWLQCPPPLCLRKLKDVVPNLKYTDTLPVMLTITQNYKHLFIWQEKQSKLLRKKVLQPTGQLRSNTSNLSTSQWVQACRIHCLLLFGGSCQSNIFATTICEHKLSDSCGSSLPYSFKCFRKNVLKGTRY